MLTGSDITRGKERLAPKAWPPTVMPGTNLLGNQGDA